MCKFCDNLEDGMVLETDEINLGVIGKVYANINMFKTDHKYKKIENKACWALTYSVSINSSVVNSYGFDIRYCPFCGQKLEESE